MTDEQPDDEEYVCIECGESFETEKELENHYDTEHSEYAV